MISVQVFTGRCFFSRIRDTLKQVEATEIYRLDWNVGYQYYNYNESPIVGPRPQNYHAHLPYTSLRFYFGQRE